MLAGVRDQHGAVRRYAFTTLQSIDFGYDVDFAATVQLANRLFRLDPEPAVRAAALSLIVVEGKSRGRNWSLIEEALDDPSPTVKAVAFQEASSAGAAEAIPYMLRGLNDETDQWTRVSAANALRAFVVTNPEVVDAVAARVDNESNTYIKELLTNVLREMRARKR